MVMLPRLPFDQVSAAIHAHLRLAYSAGRMLADLGDVLRILDTGEARCHERGRPGDALLFQHARSKILVYRREYDLALPMARAALRTRRTIENGGDVWCAAACYLETTVNALVGTGRTVEAMSMLDDALSAAPSNCRLRRARGRLRLMQGQFAAARADYDAALGQTNEPAWLLERAIARLHDGDFAGGRIDARAYWTRRRGDARAAAWLAVFGEPEPLHQLPLGVRWPARVGTFLRGQISACTLLGEAARKPYPDPYLAEGWMFVGAVRERRGDRAPGLAYEKSLLLSTSGSWTQLWARGRLNR